MVKNSPANVGDVRDAGLTPGSGRSPGGGLGNLLQYSLRVCVCVCETYVYVFLALLRCN